MAQNNNWPKLHNADVGRGWVGKGPDSEPFIDLDTMLDMTAAAQVDGVKFDGVDLFLADPHTSIDSNDDESTSSRQALPPSILSSARWWRRYGRRSGAGRRWAMRKSASVFSQRWRRLPHRQKLRDLGRRPHGVVRNRFGDRRFMTGPPIRPAIQSSSPRHSARPANIAESHGERLAAEGEICWAPCTAGKSMVNLLEKRSARPKTLGFYHLLHASLSLRVLTRVDSSVSYLC